MKIKFKGWIDKNHVWIDLAIIVALYWTGSPAIATVLLLLHVVDTM